MKKFFYCLPTLLVLAAFSLFNACEKDPEYNVPVIGVSFNELNNDFRKAAAQNAINSILALRWGYAYGSSSSLEEQELCIDTILQRGCDALIVMPHSQELFGSNVIKKVNQLGIPLICFEEKPKMADVEYAAFVSGDNISAGRNAAAFIADTLMRRIGRTVITTNVLLMTVPSESVSHERIRAFKKEIAKYSIIGIDECELSSYSREEAKEKFGVWVNSICHLAETTDAVYAQDDEIALGILDAIESMDRPFNIKVIVGCGASEKFLRRIKDSDENLALASTYYSPQTMLLCVEMATQIVSYGKYPEQKDNIIEAIVVEKSNLAEFYDELATY